MQKFLYLEGAYLIIGAVVLLVTLFVTTRPFMSKNAKKKGLTVVTVIISLMILAHFWVTTERMKEVKEAFVNGNEIICESRIIRKGAQSIIIKKSLGWKLEGDYFVSSSYSRPFFISRCIVHNK